MQEARFCVTKQIIWCLEGMEDIIKTKKQIVNNSGSFIKWMDAALDKIFEIDVQNTKNALNTLKEAKLLIEEVLCHAMSIAQVALENDAKIIKGGSHTVSIYKIIKNIFLIKIVKR